MFQSSVADYSTLPRDAAWNADMPERIRTFNIDENRTI